MIVLLIIGILFLVLACYLWVKFVMILINKLYRFAFRKKVRENENPYIKVQKARMKNDRDYEEYQIWMKKKGDGFPLAKIVTSDERQAIEKIKKYL